VREARSENLPIFEDDVKKAAIMTGLVTSHLKSNLVLAKVELDREKVRHGEARRNKKDRTTLVDQNANDRDPEVQMTRALHER
jgi:hypothetical protein